MKFLNICQCCAPRTSHVTSKYVLSLRLFSVLDCKMLNCKWTLFTAQFSLWPFTKVLGNRDGRILASKSLHSQWWDDSYTSGCSPWFWKHNINLNNLCFPVIFLTHCLSFPIFFLFSFIQHRNNISIATKVVFKAKFLYLVGDVLVPTVNSL